MRLPHLIAERTSTISWVCTTAGGWCPQPCSAFCRPRRGALCPGHIANRHEQGTQSQLCADRLGLHHQFHQLSVGRPLGAAADAKIWRTAPDNYDPDDRCRHHGRNLAGSKGGGGDSTAMVYLSIFVFGLSAWGVPLIITAAVAVRRKSVAQPPPRCGFRSQEHIV